ncbi:DUF4445 domain-containing protein [Anoxybacterium hadale]|uniref:DUF4445 domain-containing protein n=1 Tax=Anoxybacterium hadale TaxID=3408580 RepID=A0ACD1A7B4_9FIRM|nr:DUF4445 domain-containing protein [Clostridiales bacterium]
MPIINFKKEKIAVEIPQGTTILQAARNAGVLVESPCNGMGTCGKCRVKIRGNEAVLACRAIVTEDLAVETLEDKTLNNTLKIHSEGDSFTYQIDAPITKRFDGVKTQVYLRDSLLTIEEGDTENQCYGLSVDIGTTTLVSALINLATGEELASISALNPQSLHAQDVLSRIQFASKDQGLDQMYEEITSELNRMTAELCSAAGIERRFIYEAVYSGNTTMIHLALHTNPESLGKYPYTPILKGGAFVRASDYNLEISQAGVIYTPPVISAYVGPDITSGILAVRLQDVEGTVLFIDIGTNGEMALSRNGELSATSTAAGPAFEGMNITFGMRAGNGSIEGFEIHDDGAVSLQVIGGGKAVGICGSGLFDLVGELVRLGIVTENGRFANPDTLRLPQQLCSRLKEFQGKIAFEVAPDIYLTLKDVRQVQLAKGAIRAGITALLRHQGVAEEDVSQVLIAGSFGYHLKTRSLVDITIMPKSFEKKIQFVGNTSKSGGKAFLLNQRFPEEMKALVKRVNSVELANLDGFERLFVGCLNFKE